MANTQAVPMGAPQSTAPLPTSTATSTTTTATTTTMGTKPKLHGRDFYRSIGSPKYIVAPMVDRSEFAWRMLTRSYMPSPPSPSSPSTPPILAYSPMLHARLFQDGQKFRNDHFQPVRPSLSSPSSPTYPSSCPAYLDGNPTHDRPLIVQFCANSPAHLLAAAQHVAPFCDAVDLNLGCPQGIARNGHYGSFLQESPSLIAEMVATLHHHLPVPVTAKIRILDTPEQTLAYARTILDAGASFLTVHGRRREQKGHNTGLADWTVIRYLRDHLPPDTVLFANGNVLGHADLHTCLAATGADAVMSAEANLSDPTIFATPPTTVQLSQNPSLRREYWTNPAGIGGYRLDGIIRRYLDIIYEFVLEKPVPARLPLWIPGDSDPDLEPSPTSDSSPQPGKPKRDSAAISSPSLRVMQGHLFGLLRPLVSTHTEIRNTLARTRVGDMDGFERVLEMVESALREGIREHEAKKDEELEKVDEQGLTGPQRTARKYARPWWVAQPYIRPLPEEALASGALKAKKKDIEKAKTVVQARTENTKLNDSAVRRLQETTVPSQAQQPSAPTAADEPTHETPQPALVCG